MVRKERDFVETTLGRRTGCRALAHDCNHVKYRGPLLSYLCEDITKGPTNKGSEGLGSQWVLVERFVVSCPARDSATSGNSSFTKKRAIKGGVLAERRNRSLSLGVGNVLGDRRNSESRRGEAGGCNYETEELHDYEIIGFKME